MHVARLRRKRGEGHRDAIRTVRRVGYPYVPPAGQAARTRLPQPGGTESVGRAVAEAAVGRGCEVTDLHRGRHEAPPGVRMLPGDRTALDEDPGEWDVVVDTWSAAPRAGRDSARLLRGRAGRYVCVSSCTPYEWPRPAGHTEEPPVVEGASPDADVTDCASQGEAGRRTGRSGRLRRGPVGAGAGRADPGTVRDVGRLPRWLNRMARGAPVLARGPRELPLQYLDVRDLARGIPGAARQGLSGPYDLISPQGHTTTGELLEACVRATGGPAELRWTAPRCPDPTAKGLDPEAEAEVLGTSGTAGGTWTASSGRGTGTERRMRTTGACRWYPYIPAMAGESGPDASLQRR